LPSSAVRIEFVTETWPPELNGVALTTARAVDYLRARGHSVRVVRPRQRGEAARCDDQEWRTAGMALPMYPQLRLGWASSTTLQSQWRENVPDVVHVATPGPLGWNAVRAAHALGVACSADFRTQFDAYARHYGCAWAQGPLRHYLQHLHARADVNFVPTAPLATTLAGQGFEHLVVLGRGVDTQRFSPRWRDESLRRAWHVNPFEPVLLYVGRLAPEKGLDLAFHAFERWRRHLPTLRFVVVGDGPSRSALERWHPHATFLGVLEGAALARVYASADVFLFPSRTETFGNVVLEAAASGLIIAAFDQAAARAHLRDRVSACLARSDSARGFEEAVLRALATAHVPSHPMREQARQAALTADWPQVLARFESQLRLAARRVATSAPTHVRLA
jgi:glycosyltransferase involved in cell wall biosynthesis